MEGKWDEDIPAAWGEDDAPPEDAGTSAGRPLVPRPMAEPGPGRLGCPHGIATDSAGAVYVGEVCESLAGLDRGDRAVQRFVPAGTNRCTGHPK